MASSPPPTVCMVCRRGNDSQLAVRAVQQLVQEAATKEGQNNDTDFLQSMLGVVGIKDLRGGLHAWSRLFPEFPKY
eukprot:m.270660 g.270660  ORF g.270660 m.270660 type:complete len:76 (-) comp48713_c0_seq1:43-270(-)